MMGKVFNEGKEKDRLIKSWGHDYRNSTVYCWTCCLGKESA